MKILVTNDDGIRAEGIKLLAKMAADFGEVTVVAPKHQCSAMSHRITFLRPLTVEKVDDFPVEGVTAAYQVDGTPADCVKAAMEVLFDEKPDYVFSGINEGYNSGTEILYSGTVGAAMDSLIYGVPAIAWSVDFNKKYDAIRQYFHEICTELLKRPLPRNQIWNVNVPGVKGSEIRGIHYDRTPAVTPYYHDYYDVKTLEDGTIQMNAIMGDPGEAPEGTDVEALKNGYISVGTLKNII